MGSRKTLLMLRIHLCLSYPNIPFKLCRRRFPTKIALAVALSKAQEQNLKRDRVYPLSSVISMASYMLYFPDPLHFLNSLLQFLGASTEYRKWQIFNMKYCIWRSALKFQFYD
jgi:hypothetical protein